MMLQQGPAVAKEERDKISIRDVGCDNADSRGIRGQPFEACFGCSQAYERMSEIVHAELSEEIQRRGRWRKLPVTRGIYLQKLLRSLTRGIRFGNRLAVFVPRFSGRVHNLE